MESNKHELDDKELLKRNNIFNELVIELAVTEPRELYILANGIEYANVDNYYEYPQSPLEQSENEIFRIKVKCYYCRKLIEFRKDIPDLRERLTNIRNFEHREVLRIKAIFQPINYNHGR